MSSYGSSSGQAARRSAEWGGFNRAADGLPVAHALSAHAPPATARLQHPSAAMVKVAPPCASVRAPAGVASPPTQPARRGQVLDAPWPVADADFAGSSALEERV